MAKTRINKDDIAPKDIFENIEKGALTASQQVELLNKSLELTVEVAKKVEKSIKTSGKPKDTKALKERNATLDQANKLAETKRKLDSQLSQARTKEFKEVQESNLAKQKQVKLVKDEIRENSKLFNVYERQSARLNRLRKELKNLILTEGEASPKTRKLAKEVQNLDKRLKAADAAAGQFQRNVGNYPKTFASIGKSFKNLAAAAGLTMGITGIFRAVRDGIGVIKDFDQAQANLASVLGTSRDGMSRLTEQAKELGATTRFTASQVSELQLEFAKLGFSQQEINNVTDATLQLAAASGTELATAAEVTGATLRAFNMSTSETQRVVDVMAKSFSSSSLDMSKFSTAMAAVAPVANSAGFSIEETTALLGTLTDRGIDASTAGTGLRNIFLELTKEGITFEQAMERINNASDKSAASLDLFGKRGATLGVILAENGESVAKLTEELNNSAKAAEEMAEMQKKTLGGSLDLLRSAWEGYILSLDEAGGVGEKLRKGIAFLADNLDSIISIVLKVVKVFLEYKAVMLTIKALQSPLAKDILKFGKALVSAAKGANSAKVAFKGMGTALKSIGFGIAITLVLEFGQALWNIVSGAAAAEAALKAFEDAVAKAQQTSDTVKSKIRQDFDEQMRLLDLEIRERIANGENEKKLQKERLEREKELAQAARDRTSAEIDERHKLLTKLLPIEAELKRVQEEGGMAFPKAADLEAARDTLQEAGLFVSMATLRTGGNFAAVQALVAGTTEEIVLISENFKLYDSIIQETEVSIKEYGQSTGGASEKDKKRNTVLSTQIDLLKELNDLFADKLALEQEFNELDTDQKVAKLNEELDRQVEIEKKMIEDFGVFSIKDIEETLEKRKQLEKDAAKERAEFEIAELERVRTLEFQERRQGLIDEAEELKKQENITSGEIKKIEANLKAELEKLDAVELDRKDRDREKKKNILKRLNGELEDIEREHVKELESIDDNLRKEKERKDKEELDKANKRRQENLKTQEEFIKAFTDAFVEQADRRIAKIEEEISAAEKQRDFLAEAAAQGNITAKESLAEQNKIIAQSNLEKERLEQRKQQILFISSVLQAYNSNLAAGDDSTTAFTKAVASAEVLKQALVSIIELPTFFEGTEDTGKNGQGIDGKGGFLSVLHPNERVLTKNQNDRIGNYSNEELTRIMERHRLGEYVDGTQISVGWDNHILVDRLLSLEDKLESVNKSIINKPVTNIEAGRIIGGTMQIIETTDKGNTRTQRRFRVSK